MESPAPDAPPRDFEEWLVRSLVAIAGVIALVLVFGEGLIHGGREKPVEESPPLVLMPDPPEPPEPAALLALRGFFEAPDTAAKSRWVRAPDRVRSQMEDFHDHRGHPYPTLGRASQGRYVEFGGTACVLFEVEPFNGPRFPAAVIWDGHRFVVDWESLTAYGTMDWSEFLESRPEVSQSMRLFARQAPQSPPAMPPGHTAFVLEHRDSPDALIAITSGETATRLSALTNQSRAPVTLDVEFQPVGPGASLVAVITRLAHPRWSR